MTYQPPYPPSQPPQPPPGQAPQFDYYYQQQPDYLGPARKAATLLFVLGAFSIIGSFCCIGASFSVQRLMQMPEFSQKMSEVPGMTAEMLRAVTLIAGVGSLIFGVLYIILGVFVRRGSKAATITAMVLTSLATLILLLQIVGQVLTGQVGGEAVLGVCVEVLALALFVLLIVWLVGAMRAADHIAAQKYAMDYWRYAQQQQGFHPQPQQPPPPPQFPPQQPPPPPQI